MPGGKRFPCSVDFSRLYITSGLYITAEFKDDNQAVPRNTSVIIKRTPRTRARLQPAAAAAAAATALSQYVELGFVLHVSRKQAPKVTLCISLVEVRLLPSSLF